MATSKSSTTNTTTTKKATTGRKTTATKTTASKTKKTTTTKRTTKSTNTTELGLAYGFPIEGNKVVPYRELKKGYNVRFETNVHDVTTLLPSIQANGVRDNIIVSPDGIVLDGYRRLYCCELIESETKEVLKVPVQIVNVPEAEIPLFQVLCALSKDLKPVEIADAIAKYALQHPELSIRELAKTFNVVHTTVAKICTIVNASPILGEKYVNKEISQQAAIKVATVHKNTASFSSTPAKSKAFFTDVLTQAETFRLEEIEQGKNPKQINGRHVNKAIKFLYPYTTTTSSSGESTGEGSGSSTSEKKTKRFNLKTLVSKLLQNAAISNFVDTETNEPLVELSVNFCLKPEEYQLLQESIASEKVAENVMTVKHNLKKDETLYQVWYDLCAKEKFADKLVGIKHDNIYIFFESAGEIISEELHTKLTAYEGTQACIVPATQNLNKSKLDIVLVQIIEKQTKKMTEQNTETETVEQSEEIQEETPAANTIENEQSSVVSTEVEETPEIEEVTPESEKAPEEEEEEENEFDEENIESNLDSLFKGGAVDVDDMFGDDADENPEEGLFA